MARFLLVVALIAAISVGIGGSPVSQLSVPGQHGGQQQDFQRPGQVFDAQKQRTGFGQGDQHHPQQQQLPGGYGGQSGAGQQQHTAAGVQGQQSGQFRRDEGLVNPGQPQQQQQQQQHRQLDVNPQRQGQQNVPSAQHFPEQQLQRAQAVRVNKRSVVSQLKESSHNEEGMSGKDKLPATRSEGEGAKQDHKQHGEGHEHKQHHGEGHEAKQGHETAHHERKLN
ncbi:unnamed protein product [Notodromas monacha]|uniref:Uncharacterized protein n=1 Tax=Notodromas monacha TaxID=399045 RepID=A0A7R9C2Q9_9CRUS|nr:unnamed protein product [Notodromas monacha]CAG0925045.1 unnamed protein product [Notodromas monacha]